MPDWNADKVLSRVARVRELASRGTTEAEREVAKTTLLRLVAHATSDAQALTPTSRDYFLARLNAVISGVPLAARPSAPPRPSRRWSEPGYVAPAETAAADAEASARRHSRWPSILPGSRVRTAGDDGSRAGTVVRYSHSSDGAHFQRVLWDDGDESDAPEAVLVVVRPPRRAAT
ncbi:hypothetical protein NK718_04935 [Alsobacter sp. SYSU M60028]|uniref:Uncharacterized protein n=1 Tax=Alsobacter ponti TaxID=2962936 RepID=A0ABT1LA59_9HYPH|nr:hypothetical protein [Alsobacter ponti]MCP8937851.1 hypothetical protein [Alsobacter ponti]